MSSSRSFHPPVTCFSLPFTKKTVNGARQKANQLCDLLVRVAEKDAKVHEMLLAFAKDPSTTPYDQGLKDRANLVHSCTLKRLLPYNKRLVNNAGKMSVCNAVGAVNQAGFKKANPGLYYKKEETERSVPAVASFSNGNTI